MIKNKENVGKIGDNHPTGATVVGTEMTRVGGQIPATAALPTMADQPAYMLQTPNAQMPSPQDSATLPMFNPTTGYHDSGASAGSQG